MAGYRRFSWLVLFYLVDVGSLVRGAEIVSIDRDWESDVPKCGIKVTLAADPVNCDTQGAIDVRIRLHNIGDRRVLYNPCLRTSWGLPAKLCLFDSEERYLGNLLERNLDFASYAPPSRRYGTWIDVPRLCYVGRIIRVTEGVLEKLLKNHHDSYERDSRSGVYYLQLLFDERLAQAPPDDTDHYARTRFDDPAPWRQLVRSSVLDSDLRPRRPKPTPVDDSEAMKEVRIGSSKIWPILAPQRTRIVRGREVIVDMGFENLGNNAYFYNPFFCQDLPSAADLVVLDDRKQYLGCLAPKEILSVRHPTVRDWALIPTRGLVGTVRHYRTALTTEKSTGNDGTAMKELPPGDYFLQVIYHRRFVSWTPRSATEADDLPQQRRKSAYSDCPRSTPVRIEIVDN